MRSIRGSSKGWNALKTKKRKPPKPKMKCYEARKHRLSVLGYASYQAYLESEDWRKLRDNKLRLYPDCLLCENKAENVHHLSYDFETLLGVTDYRLVQLCRDCHEKIEFKGEKKRTLREANGALFKLAEGTPRGARWIEWVGHQKDRYKHARRVRKNKAKRRQG